MKKKLIMLYLIFAEIINRCKKTIIIQDSWETLDRIYSERKSIARFGDGEYNIMFRDNLVFQKYNEDLAAKLKNVLRDGENNDNCLIGIPYSMYSFKGFTNASIIFWLKYFAKNRKKITDNLNNNLQYYDAQISRVYVNRKNKNCAKELFDKWKRIWDSKTILLVEGEQSRLGVGNSLFNNAKTVKRIICPAENAFEKYEEIYQSILAENDYDVCLVSLGPTATVLAYDLSKIGIWSIDTGNMDMEYEWMLMQAKTQTAINGKYTIEAKNGTTVEECKDEIYKSQVIKKIL